MTQPGVIIPPQPGWWVRTARIGTNQSSYGWVALTTSTGGLGTGTYGWAASAAGGGFPETFPITLA